MQLQTSSTKRDDIKRLWHSFDVKDKVLGRVATEIALKLMGKDKSYFVKHLDCGDYVVVTNAKLVKLTGHKETEKIYSTYSGYPGGIKNKPAWVIREEKPTQLIRHAVFGMLPKNKLRNRLITRLYIYPDEEHPYKEKIQK